jgi:hypothetical protein
MMVFPPFRIDFSPKLYKIVICRSVKSSNWKILTLRKKSLPKFRMTLFEYIIKQTLKKFTLNFGSDVFSKFKG